MAEAPGIATELESTEWIPGRSDDPAMGASPGLANRVEAPGIATELEPTEWIPGRSDDQAEGGRYRVRLGWRRRESPPSWNPRSGFQGGPMTKPREDATASD